MGDSAFWDLFVETLTLRSHNTRVVVIGAMLLGLAAGMIGSFAYLRKRSLMGDALSHATLPGIAVAFLIAGEKSLTLLIAGAVVTGVLGVLAVVGVSRSSRIREDAAIGMVLSVFFAVGLVLMGVIQQLPTGNQAGLNAFIYGKAAAMLNRDAVLIAIAAGIVIAACLLFFKEFRAVCFDPQFAHSQGIRVMLVDLAMMALVVVTTVVGLQAVGLIMIVALLIVPAAAARFWTDALKRMVMLSGIFGALSGWLGATISALVPKMPAGAIIVLTGGAIFSLSMIAAPKRGLVAGWVRRISIARKVAFQNLLRALAELEEQQGRGAAITLRQVAGMRAWSLVHVRLLVQRARRLGLLRPGIGQSADQLVLTESGRLQAQRVLRNHRLWEAYLIRYADIAPSHVDRDADEVEHVLSEDIIDELDRILAGRQPVIPPSPHQSPQVN